MESILLFLMDEEGHQLEEVEILMSSTLLWVRKFKRMIFNSLSRDKPSVQILEPTSPVIIILVRRSAPSGHETLMIMILIFRNRVTACALTHAWKISVHFYDTALKFQLLYTSRHKRLPGMSPIL